MKNRFFFSRPAESAARDAQHSDRDGRAPQSDPGSAPKAFGARAGVSPAESAARDAQQSDRDGRAPRVPPAICAAVLSAFGLCLLLAVVSSFILLTSAFAGPVIYPPAVTVNGSNYYDRILNFGTTSVTETNIGGAKVLIFNSLGSGGGSPNVSTATNAIEAGHATNATFASNAGNLGGIPAASYPTNLPGRTVYWSPSGAGDGTNYPAGTWGQVTNSVIALSPTPTNRVTVQLLAGMFPQFAGSITNTIANIDISGSPGSVLTFSSGGFVQSGTNSTLNRITIAGTPSNTGCGYTETGFLNAKISGVTISYPNGPAIQTFYNDGYNLSLGGTIGISNVFGGHIYSSDITGTNFGVAEMREYPSETSLVTVNTVRLPNISGSYIRCTASNGVGVAASNSGSDSHQLVGDFILCPVNVNATSNAFTVGVTGSVWMVGCVVQAHQVGRGLLNTWANGCTFLSTSHADLFSCFDGLVGCQFVGCGISGSHVLPLIQNATSFSVAVNCMLEGEIGSHPEWYMNCSLGNGTTLGYVGGDPLTYAWTNSAVWRDDGATISVTNTTTTLTPTNKLFNLVLSTNTTLVLNGQNSGRSITLFVTQDSRGGWTNAWPANVIWPYGVAPTPTTNAGATDKFRLDSNGLNWFGSVLGSSYAAITNGNFAFQFDGIQNYVTVPNATNFYSAGTFTCQFWMKSSATNGSTGWILGNYNGTNGWGVGLSNGFIYARATITNNAVVFGCTNCVNDGNWHEIEFVNKKGSPSTFALFVDGTKYSGLGSFGPMSNGVSAFQIGRAPEGAGLAATIDEVALLPWGLHTSNFSTNSLACLTSTNDIAYYKLNEGGGLVTLDAGPRAFNGAITGTNIVRVAGSCTTLTDTNGFGALPAADSTKFLNQAGNWTTPASACAGCIVSNALSSSFYYTAGSSSIISGVVDKVLIVTNATGLSNIYTPCVSAQTNLFEIANQSVSYVYVKSDNSCNGPGNINGVPVGDTGSFSISPGIAFRFTSDGNLNWYTSSPGLPR